MRGLKLALKNRVEENDKSHPVRGAWIEILHILLYAMYDIVASRKGCVD